MSHKKSIDEHKKAGTFRPNRHGNRANDTGNLAELPPPPFQLPKTALGVYESEGAQLVSLGILRAENTRLLASYALEMATYVELMEKAAQDGILETLPNGIETASPARKTAERALKNASALADKLGLTPIGRARLGIKSQPPPPHDPFAEFLNN